MTKKGGFTPNPEYSNQVEERLWSKIVEIEDGCYQLDGKYLDFNGRPKRNFFYGAKSVYPYVAAWAIKCNNGNLPPPTFKGKRSMIMHDDENCLHRPNCVNPAHLQLGNADENARTAKRNFGEDSHLAIFSNQDKEKILELFNQKISRETIYLQFPKYTASQIYSLVVKTNGRIRKKKNSFESLEKNSHVMF